MLLPAIGFASGILSALWVDWRRSELLLLVAVLVPAAAVSRYRQWYVAAVLCACGALAGVFHKPGPTPVLDAPLGELVTIAGCVVEPPSFSEGREQFVLEVKPQARVRVSLYLREDEAPPALAYGQRVEVEARLRRPRNYGNPGSFDYEAYLARRQIYWTASVPSHSRPRVLEGVCGSAAAAWLCALRGRVLERIEELYAGNAYAIGVLEALVVGESARLERAWSDTFRRTGTYHAIVISGLHVAVIAATLTALLRLLALRRNTARLIAVLAIWIYAGVCGWQAPVVRSAAGFTLFAIGCYYYRECRLLNLLAAVALVFLAVDAQQIVEASFQLTFLSVLTLGALAWPAVEGTTAGLRHGLRDLPDTDKDMHLPPRIAQFRIELRLAAETAHFVMRLPAAAAAWILRIALWGLFWIWETMLVSAIVQLGLALPMVVYFHRLSLSGLTANVLVTPMLTAAVPLSFAAVWTGWGWLATAVRWLVEISRALVEWHARWEPGWRVPDPPMWLGAAFVASLVMLAVFRRRLLIPPALALLAVIVWHPFEPQRVAGALELTMIDVGQGESLLAGFPDGTWLLVDGGGIPLFGKRLVKPRLDIGEDVVSAYLFSRSIRRIDVLVSTHQHDDHAGGLAALIENFRPRQLWAGATPESEAWRALQEKAARTGAVVRNLRRSPPFAFGGAAIEVLGPPPDYVPRSAPSNNDSLVLRLVHGAHSFLLTGDVERAMEFAMLDGARKADVLKVAHHGSRTSTTDVFLDTVQPAFALISAGKENLFRHPHSDVVRRLGERKVATFRTDEWGLITVRSDGRRFQVHSHRWEPRGTGIQQPF